VARMLLPIVANSKACTGCRVCELMCSFHHKGVFSPDSSSIRVLSNYRTGMSELSIDSTCDSCRGEEQPLCISYCVFGVLREVKRDDGR